MSVVDKKTFAGRLRQALAESDIETVTELDVSVDWLTGRTNCKEVSR